MRPLESAGRGNRPMRRATSYSERDTVARGVEFPVNSVLAPLFDQFLKERRFLKNVTERRWSGIAWPSGLRGHPVSGCGIAAGEADVAAVRRVPAEPGQAHESMLTRTVAGGCERQQPNRVRSLSLCASGWLGV